MADVFLKDRDLVQALAQGLEREGISVWWDKKIAAGGTWRDTIAAALGQAKVVVVAWSKRTEDTSEAAWVFNEVDEAQRMKLPIIPVQLEACNVPLGYRHVQAADLTGWRGDPKHPEWLEVLDGVRAAIAGRAIGGAAPRRAGAPPRPAAAPSRGGGGGMWMALVAVIVLAGGAYYAWRTFGAPSAPAPITAEPTPTADAPVASSISTVRFRANDGATGEFRLEAPGVWGEYNQAGVRMFAFRVLNASDTYIELFDPTRSIWIALDVSNNSVLIRDAISAYQPFYGIAGTERAAAQPIRQPGAPRVIRVSHEGRVTNAFRREAGGGWSEYDPGGARLFQFVVRAETTERLELYDQSRDVSLIFDLAEGRIAYRQGQQAPTPLYVISAIES